MLLAHAFNIACSNPLVATLLSAILFEVAASEAFARVQGRISQSGKFWSILGSTSDTRAHVAHGLAMGVGCKHGQHLCALHAVIKDFTTQYLGADTKVGQGLIRVRPPVHAPCMHALQQYLQFSALSGQKNCCHVRSCGV